MRQTEKNYNSKCREILIANFTFSRTFDEICGKMRARTNPRAYFSVARWLRLARKAYGPGSRSEHLDQPKDFSKHLEQPANSRALKTPPRSYPLKCREAQKVVKRHREHSTQTQLRCMESTRSICRLHCDVLRKSAL